MPVFQPLTARPDHQAVQAATTPQARVFVALAAVHAARPGQIRALQLSDADLGNRRLTIAGRTRPLDDLTPRLLEWLTTGMPAGRTPPTPTCWSATAPHPAPGRSATVAAHLRGLPATLDRLRITGSSRKPSPTAPTRCTWRPCSAWTTPPPSATPPPPSTSWSTVTRPASLYPQAPGSRGTGHGERRGHSGPT